MKAVCIEDFRRQARKRLPPFLFHYIDGGAYDEQTYRENDQDLQRVRLRQRVLKDVSVIDKTSTVFGQEYALPFGLGPVGLAGMNARRGETQAARAAANSGIPFCLSTVSACALEEVVAADPTPFWFQLYIMRDRSFLNEMLDKATAAQCSALMVTVDMPVPGLRRRDYSTALAGAPGVLGTMRRFAQSASRPQWAWDVGLRGQPHTLGNVAPLLGRKSGLEDFMAWMGANFDPTVTWSDIEYIRSRWSGPLILKGILDAEDAITAKQVGADGIVVSNHGGRQLDGVPSTIQSLPVVAAAVQGDLTVMFDGGVRSGLDIVRALAMGADFVLLGRAWAYALGAAGQVGIERMVEVLQSEMQIAMALTGCTKLSDIGRDIISSEPDYGMSPTLELQATSKRRHSGQTSCSEREMQT
ncbi:MAG: L-lactate dehydrogenase [Pseudomonadota bacterium]